MRYIKGSLCCFIFAVFMVTNAFAWEVTTHQQLTRLAVTGDDQAENLDFFVRTFDLEDEDYSEEGDKDGDTLYWWRGFTKRIAEASGSYVQVAKDLTGISLKGGKYIGLIETGAILEDSLLKKITIPYSNPILPYPNLKTTDKASIISARFNRHFYDPHEDECYGLKGTATCTKEWALNGGNAKDHNKYSWVEALKYYSDSVLGESKEDRKNAQASLFVSMGFLSHLMEDMAQAAHVRNDAHGMSGNVNVFEEWANDEFNTVKNFSLPSVTTMNPVSFNEHFTDVARFTHDHFFSDDTFPWEDNYGGHPLPATSNVTEEAIAKNSTTFYLLSSGLEDTPTKGTGILDGTKLGFHVVNKWWLDSWSLVEAGDNSVLKENAKIVFPRAIGAAEGLINFFFRARIIASPDPDDANKLTIKNITRQNVVNDNADVTIKTGATIHVYYETADGTRLPLPNIGEQPPLDQDLDNDESITVEGLADAIDEVSDSSLPDSERIDDQKTIVVVIKGLMGGSDQDEDRIIAASRFVYTANASILLTFDISYSMDGELEYAKSSGQSIIPLLSGGENNYMAVYSFDDSVYANQDYTNDFPAIQSAIASLDVGGDTSLYDAIIISGENASTHKSNYPDNKSIVVLYTDGSENDSVNSKQSAINAISKLQHPEIDEVFLVFINTGDDSGRQDLEDIADQAGREFLYLTDPAQLAPELMSILH